MNKTFALICPGIKIFMIVNSRITNVHQVSRYDNMTLNIMMSSESDSPMKHYLPLKEVCPDSLHAVMPSLLSQMFPSAV